MTVRAIFENGVFRPTEAVALPEHTEVELEYKGLQTAQAVNTSPKGMEAIYAILSERYDGGDPEVAAKHDEHQP
ncbi:MAG TPA: antitoxin family protein [Phycisphaerae bacterium]|jgi:predicted DNA-binding antitoxin AbrB/MazE fold protein